MISKDTYFIYIILISKLLRSFTLKTVDRILKRLHRFSVVIAICIATSI